VTSETPNANARNRSKASHPPVRPALSKRLLRALPVLVLLLILTWVFARTGVLHKLETSVTDAEMRLNPPPADSPVAIVNITDDDYQALFDGTSPLDPAQLQKLLADIAKGEPAVIGVDIDTSAPKFSTQFKLADWGPRIVWEREVRQVPEDATSHGDLEPLDILGGQKNIDPARNSAGLPLLIDDADDKVTRRYRRLIATNVGQLPSFPWAITKAYLHDKPAERAKLEESSEDLLIHYSGDRSGSHRLHFSAAKVEELCQYWPSASPIRGRIVLLGGSYLGQDRHDTPIGRITGLEVVANVIETELAGGGYKSPGRGVLFMLELFEAFGLILLFHIFRLRQALVWSIVFVPMIAALCSKLAYGNIHHFLQFALILLGLLVFELYEHFRRTTVPQIYHDIAST
jgi:CHASE2 domain-containing sensor protein